ncbi:MAG TPA: crosslink repair DNA glycosylase YcaQ family protein [Chloroflexota bacterium]|nr:crosslink repair DNA glycosylase YcaQ family protein [Chloroflexota bacterium]
MTPTGQAGNYPVLLVDGVVGGVWHQRRSGRQFAITVEPLRELTATQRQQVATESHLSGATGAVVARLRPTHRRMPESLDSHAKPVPQYQSCLAGRRR